MDPDIEGANREDEGKSVERLDEKEVKNNVDMVVDGIMSVETAQELLGLDPAKNKSISKTEAAWGGLFTKADYSDDVCDSCGYFDDEHNRCGVTQAEVTFDSPACRFIQHKRVEKP